MILIGTSIEIIGEIMILNSIEIIINKIYYVNNDEKLTCPQMWLRSAGWEPPDIFATWTSDWSHTIGGAVIVIDLENKWVGVFQSL